MGRTENPPPPPRKIPKCSFGMSSEQIYFCTTVQHLSCHLQTIIRKAQLHVSYKVTDVYINNIKIDKMENGQRQEAFCLFPKFIPLGDSIESFPPFLSSSKKKRIYSLLNPLLSFLPLLSPHKNQARGEAHSFNR